MASRLVWTDLALGEKKERAPRNGLPWWLPGRSGPGRCIERTWAIGRKPASSSIRPCWIAVGYGQANGGKPRLPRDDAREVMAVEALGEVRKFLPADAVRMPLSAFFTPAGQAVYGADPAQFSRRRLTALSDGCQRILAAYGG